MERISRSWRLMQASMAVLAADKELRCSPPLGLAMLPVSITFLWPAYALGLVSDVQSGTEGARWTGYVVLFVFYVVQYTVVILQLALVGMALMRLDGRDPTVSDGFRIAASHARTILGYALIAATVGVVLSMVRERGGAAGRAVSSFGGMAWNLATFLVVPVLVVENVGPVEAVKRSGALLKRTWGEQIVGGVGIGLVTFLAVMALVAVFVPLMVLAAQTASIALITTIVAIFTVLLIALIMVNGALGAIFTAAVYRYAVDGEAGQFFDQELVASAFRTK